VLTVVKGRVKRRDDLRASIRASVVASKVLYVQHVKENRRNTSEIHLGNRRTLTQCDAYDWDPACT